MFPVPSHLPKTRGENASSGNDGRVSPPDRVLDFLDPLLLETGPSKRVRYLGRQVKDAGANLLKAIQDNKVHGDSSKRYVEVLTVLTGQKS